ncbi:MAG: hypothetical protein FJY98_03525 [Candidatus Liptonbacteria bacterium]|nr:hypothetical protein [Candidatus Liptonbacteria bacterium]
MEKVAIFDLDHTLLDTTGLRKEMLQILQGCGLTTAEAKSSLQDFMDNHEGNYDMLGHCEELIKDKKISSLDKIHTFLSSSFEKHIIQDAKEVLRELKKRNYYLILLTKGIERFQKTKLAQTGLANLFDEIRIVAKFKEEALETINVPAGSYFINDKREESERVMRVHPHLKYILFGKTDASETIIQITRLSELLDLLL